MMSLNKLSLIELVFVVNDVTGVTSAPARIVRTVSTRTENYPVIPLAVIPTPRKFPPVSSLRQR